MTRIDTAKARRIHATADDMKHGDCHTARAVLTGMMPNMLNEIDRLQAENQRLTDEIESVLQFMDGLAEQWGDEAVFRRCRDRLRALTKEAGK